MHKSRITKWLPLAVLLGCGALMAAEAAMAAERIDFKQAAANDPRSGAALNRDAAIRALKAGTVPALRRPSQRRIGHLPVNDPGADATDKDTQSETTIIDLGGGNLVAAFNDSGSFLGGAFHFTGYAFSSNNGESWTDGGTLPASAEGDAGDPVLAAHSGSSSVYLATLGFDTGENIQVFKSVDSGHTFGAPVNGTPGFAGTGDFQDKEWMTVDNFAGGGNGNVYLCWTRFLGGGGAEIRLTRSTDGGATFGPNQGVLLSTGGQGCFVVVRPNHNVHVFYYRGTGGSGQGGDNKLFVRRSTDQGVSFSAEVQVADLATTTINGGLALNGGPRSNSFPHAAANPVRGSQYLYAVYNDLTAPGDADIFLTYSTNGGSTWSAPIRVNDDTEGDQFFPTIAFTQSGGRLMISYYSRSLDPDNLAFHRRARIGRLQADGSVKFYPSFQIGPNTPIVIGQDPVINPTYMGDYDQIAGGTKNFKATWSDNRMGNAFHANQPDVYFARFPAFPAAADLGVNVTISPDTIGLGETAVFEVTATALSGDPDDVYLSMLLSQGMAIQSVTANKVQCTIINQFVDCLMGSLALGKSRSVKIVAAGTQKGKFKLTAVGTTSSRETKATLKNNSASATVVVTQGSAITKKYWTGNIAVAFGSSPTTVDIPITVNDVGTVLGVRSEVRLNHTWDADVQISLVAPTGEIVSLSNGRGGSGDNYGTGSNDCSGTRTIFSDKATTSISAGTPPFAGSFKPEQPLGNLFGVATNGTWLLRVTDTFPGADDGVVGCVVLAITTPP